MEDRIAALHLLETSPDRTLWAGKRLSEFPGEAEASDAASGWNPAGSESSNSWQTYAQTCA